MRRGEDESLTLCSTCLPETWSIRNREFPEYTVFSHCVCVCVCVKEGGCATLLMDFPVNRVLYCYTFKVQRFIQS